MPPRHSYWTILVDDQPTAFRAHDPEELLPTLNRLRDKNASAVMKWFERGQLFESRDAAREAGLGRGERRWEGPRPERNDEGRPSRDARESGRPREAREPREPREPREARERQQDDRPRDKTWRPGGEHRDPRQKYQDAKKAKWNRFKEKIRERHEGRDRGQDDVRDRDDVRGQDEARGRAPQYRTTDRPDRSTESRPPFSPPHGDPPRERRDDRPRDRQREDRPYEDRTGTSARPHGDTLRPRKPWGGSSTGSAGGDRRPWGTKPGTGGKKPWGAKPGGRKPWGAKPAGSSKPWGAKPAGSSQPWSDKPGKPAGSTKPWGARPAGNRKPWGAKPAGGRPRGAKPAGGKPWEAKPGGGGRKPAFNSARSKWGAKPAARPRNPSNSKPAGDAPRRRRDEDE